MKKLMELLTRAALTEAREKAIVALFLAGVSIVVITILLSFSPDDLDTVIEELLDE